MADGAEEKTEKPTARRLSEAREKGDVAQSKELVSFLILSAVSLYFYFAGSSLFRSLLVMFDRLLRESHRRLNSLDELTLFAGELMVESILIMLPILSIALAIGVIAYVSQVGILFTTHKLNFDITKLDPIKGFTRMFSRQLLIELAKGIAKLAIIGWIAYTVIKANLEAVAAAGVLDIMAIAGLTFQICIDLMIPILVFLLVLAVLDFWYQRFDYEQKLMMSKQEIKEEFKQREGNPQVKSRIMGIMRERLRKIMAANVKKADVVVTNPTHFAVALKYEREQMKAPKVVAKGADWMALKIREIASAHSIPIVERKSLARELFNGVDIDEEVPEVLYTAVAEVLAYVYRLNRKFKRLKPRAKRMSHASA